MAPKKLSDADRQDILTRYRQPEENTVTIANHYGVSTSTISRILKQNLSEAEYESLIQQKRSGTQKPPEQVVLPGVETAEPASLVAEVTRSVDRPSPAAPRRRQRKPVAVDDLPASEPLNQLEIVTLASGHASGLDELAKAAAEIPVEKQELEEIEAELGTAVVETSPALAEPLDEELEDDLEEDELEDDLDDLEDLEDDLEEDDLDDEDELTNAEGFSAVQLHGGEFVQVLPLTDADIPRTCYVVVDRSSELITRPLKDFADLGQIPEGEILERTLPIFDNHRIAKRFTRRMQRVVKVPDGRVFQKVKSHLQAKGITRLLIDGQVYSL